MALLSRFSRVIPAASVGLFLLLLTSCGEKPFDYRGMAGLTGSVLADKGGGTGVVVAPGENGNVRVLTNGHVCDMISAWPADKDEANRLTEKQSLYLPVNAKFARADGRKPARVLKIVKHTYIPDLCLVEVEEKSDGKFAKVALRLPQWGETFAAGGYPRLMAFTVTRGEFWGLINTPIPPRIWRPDQELEVLGLLFADGLCKQLKNSNGGKIPDKFKKFCEKVSKDVEKLTKPIPYSSGLYHFDVLPGNSGSGIWDRDGKLVGLVWGVVREGYSYSLGVSYYDVRLFLETAPK